MRGAQIISKKIKSKYFSKLHLRVSLFWKDTATTTNRQSTRVLLVHWVNISLILMPLNHQNP